MKIAHIITRLIVGGAQENTLLTVEDHIADFGDDVTLITGPALGPEGSLMERAAKSGCRLIELPSLRRNIHPWREFQAYRDIRRQLKSLRPDLVHTHSSKAGILGRKAAGSLKLPCVHTIHGAAFHYGQHPLAFSAYRLAEQIAARWTDHYISVADAMTRQYLQAGIAEADRYTTIYSGFDTAPFLADPTHRDTLRQQWGLDQETILIGKIGRLFPLKGHDAILKVAPDVIRAVPNVKFLFIGDGILRETFQKQIAELGLTEHFIFTGLVPPEQIPTLMQAVEIVAHTSQWEGLARVLPQALLSGKPIVSFDIDGAREVAIPDQTGFLIPRNDFSALSSALITLAGDAEMRSRLGEQGRQRFREQFHHQFMSSRIRDVYSRVLEGRQKRS
ncbi:MAG: glycosyltransferase family 4 protein [Planctomycetaceae bacterium]|nr:glycosyltransferase family 4 protein [Planctomycetaceae bacterium]